MLLFVKVKKMLIVWNKRGINYFLLPPSAIVADITERMYLNHISSTKVGDDSKEGVDKCINFPPTISNI